MDECNVVEVNKFLDWRFVIVMYKNFGNMSFFLVWFNIFKWSVVLYLFFLFKRNEI